MKHKLLSGLGIFIMSLLSVTMSVAQNDPLVFPGAEGYGRYATAGRGGKILRVTNLNNDGEGSLRAACLGEGARIVVFEVSGIIALESAIVIKSPNITIAGQTAPSPGILIKNAPITVKASEVLIQHLAFRLGEEPGDAFSLSSTNGEVSNVVLDHLSISWANDENFGFFQGEFQVKNISISNCIVSEALSGGKGLLINQSQESFDIPIDNISITNCIFAHNSKRNPKIKNGVRSLLANNVTYNWELSAVDLGENSQMPLLLSMLNNVYISGSNTSSDRLPLSFRPQLASNSELFLSGNSFNGQIPENQSDLISDIGTKDVSLVALASPIAIDVVELLETAQVLDTVTKYAGSRPGMRDAVDTRVIEEVRNKTGEIRREFSEIPNGWPDYPVNNQPFELPENPEGDDDEDGYSNLEEKLHDLKLQVEGRSADEEPDNAPTISDIPDQQTAQDTKTDAIEFIIGDDKTAVDALTLSGTSSNTDLVTNDGIVFSGNDDERSVVVTPVNDQSGETTITITVSDGNKSASESFTLTVEKDEPVEPVGISDEYFGASLKLYPNPTEADFHIEFNNTYLGKVSIVVYDLSGKQISALTVNKNAHNFSLQVDSPKINGGVIIVSIEGDDFSIRRKLVRI